MVRGPSVKSSPAAGSLQQFLKKGKPPASTNGKEETPQAKSRQRKRSKDAEVATTNGVAATKKENRKPDGKDHASTPTSSELATAGNRPSRKRTPKSSQPAAAVDVSKKPRATKTPAKKDKSVAVKVTGKAGKEDLVMETATTKTKSKPPKSTDKKAGKDNMKAPAVSAAVTPSSRQGTTKQRGKNQTPSSQAAGIGDDKTQKRQAIAATKTKPPGQADPEISPCKLDSPSRKRCRLSRTKSCRAVAKLGPLLAAETKKEGGSTPSVKDMLTNSKAETKNLDAVADAKPRPSIAALHNLGNTCFLNSVLQVLRYTPGFVSNVNTLASQIQVTLEEKTCLQEMEGAEASEEHPDEVLVWTIVRNLQQVYSQMTRAEENFRAGTTSFLAIRPYQLLDTIELLNPMFEGHQQQDAHELLRCVLAYVQEAAKELNTFRRKYYDATPAVCAQTQLQRPPLPEVIAAEDTCENEQQTSSLPVGSPLKQSMGSLTQSLAPVYNTDVVEVKEEVPRMVPRDGPDLSAHLDQVIAKCIVKSEQREQTSCTLLSQTNDCKLELVISNEVCADDTVTCTALVANPISEGKADCKTLKKFCSDSQLNGKQGTPRKLYRSKSFGQLGQPSLPCVELRESFQSKLITHDRPANDVASCPRSSSCSDISVLHKPTPDFTMPMSETPANGGPGRKRKLSDPILPASKVRINRSRCLSESHEAGVTINGTLCNLLEKYSSVTDAIKDSPEDRQERLGIFSLFLPKVSVKRLGMSRVTIPSATLPVHKSRPSAELDQPSLASATPPDSPSGRRKDLVKVDPDVAFTVHYNETRAARALQRNQQMADTGSHQDEMVPEEEALLGVKKCLIVRKTPTARKSLGVRRTPACQPNTSSENMEHEDCDPSGTTLKSSSVSNSTEALQLSESVNGCPGEEEGGSLVTQGRRAVVPLCASDVNSYLDHQRGLQAIRTTTSIEDTIENTFQGQMALRTRCLECERFTERREDYLDISVAVRQQCTNNEDDEEEEEEEGAPWAWLLSAFHEVERLCDDNKYHCEQCLRLVEAERSTHYVTMANVMTFHLKRFAATNGMCGGFTKINDHVVTPFQLPCLQEKCGRQCNEPSHNFELYAVLTHTGICLSSGHYISYVRVPKAAPAATSPPPDVDQAPLCPAPDAAAATQTPSPMDTGDADMADPNNNADGNNNVAAVALPTQNVPIVPPPAPPAEDSDKFEWLECDDDHIRVLSSAEFHELLSPAGRSRPYLLFYHRTEQDDNCLMQQRLSNTSMENDADKAAQTVT